MIAELSANVRFAARDRLEIVARADDLDDPFVQVIETLHHRRRKTDRALFAVVRWWGGVPACYALRPVVVVRRGSMIRVRLAEGTVVPAGTACIDMAMLKAARIDLGQLASGRYTIVAGDLSTVLTVA